MADINPITSVIRLNENGTENTRRAWASSGARKQDIAQEPKGWRIGKVAMGKSAAIWEAK